MEPPTLCRFIHQALRAKLVEEAQEAAAANDGDLVTELADLCEVIDTLMAASGIDRETVFTPAKTEPA